MTTTTTTPRSIEAVLGDVARTHAQLRAAGRPHRLHLLELTAEVHRLAEAGDPVASAWFRRSARRVLVSFAGGEAALARLLDQADAAEVAGKDGGPTRAEVEEALASLDQQIDQPTEPAA